MKLEINLTEDQIDEIVGWTRQTTYLAEMKQELHKMKEQARLAPAPEEAVIQDSRITEPTPDWRELGPDEVIQEGDEEMHEEQTSWFPIEYNDVAIGTYAGIWSNFRFRTRRPLPPVVDQPQPITK